MATLPHDLSDLYLSPVVLELDARLDELGTLDLSNLTSRVAIDSNLPDRSREQRESALLRSIQQLIELHGWSLAWDTRGVRMTHGEHSLVLGVSRTLSEYLEGRTASVGA
jgi:hypothetical protein